MIEPPLKIQLTLNMIRIYGIVNFPRYPPYTILNKLQSLLDYNKLWKLLIDLNMSRSQLREKAGVTTNVIAKMGKNENVLDNHLVIGNFGGYPSITIPYNKLNNMPIGINITSGYKKDGEMLSIANNIESIIKEDNNV